VDAARPPLTRVGKKSATVPEQRGRSPGAMPGLRWKPQGLGTEANRRWDAAREAYAHRPARFEIEGQGRNTPNRPPAATTGDGFQVVASKKRMRIVSGTQDETRKAGRPRAIAKAGQANGQTLRWHTAAPIASAVRAENEDANDPPNGEWRW
jgi:hypothetical protein